jgi:hypothetical protein
MLASLDQQRFAYNHFGWGEAGQKVLPPGRFFPHRFPSLIPTQPTTESTQVVDQW